jgi:hypothetical protein
MRGFIMNNQNYFGQFQDWSDVVSNFNLDRSTLEPKYVWASYNGGSYDGYSAVVFFDEGEWKLVTGSHCSCYGLEGQFDPDTFDPEVHFKALTEGKRYVSDYTQSLSDQTEFDEWLKWAVEQAS